MRVYRGFGKLVQEYKMFWGDPKMFWGRLAQGQKYSSIPCAC